MFYSTRFRLPRLFAIVLSVIVAAPLGLVLPYVIGSYSSPSFGFVSLLLLLWPSLILAALSARALGQAALLAASPLFGCAATFASYLVFILSAAIFDPLCERFSYGCGATAYWLPSSLTWIALIGGSLLLASTDTSFPRSPR